MPKVKSVVELDRDELKSILGYSVLVECWDRIMTSTSRRRKYHDAFTERERKKIARYKKLFYQWYLVKGCPDNYTFPVEDYNLLMRSVSFFSLEY